MRCYYNSSKYHVVFRNEEKSLLKMGDSFKQTVNENAVIFGRKKEEKSLLESHNW